MAIVAPSSIALHFNPHPRTEGDFAYVSFIKSHLNFNPHPRTEGDMQGVAGLLHTKVFQPTPSHGG